MFLRIISASIPFVIVFALVLFPESAPSRLTRDASIFFFRPLMRAGSLMRISTTPSDAGSEELARLRAENEILRLENKNLQNTLGLRSELGPLIGAQVLTFGREFGKEYLIIDIPADQQFQAGQFVLDDQGLVVGRVSEVLGRSAEVRIISNPEETLDADIIPGDIRTLARGRGGRAFALDLVPNSVPIRPGDVVVSRIRGISRPVILGQVVRARRSVNSAFQEIAATLLSRPERLQRVFLLETL